MNCRKWFYFLNFGWGKSLAHLFIASIMLGSGAAIVWLDTLVAIYLLILVLWMPVVSVYYRKNEKLLVEDKLNQIQKNCSKINE